MGDYTDGDGQEWIIPQTERERKILKMAIIADWVMQDEDDEGKPVDRFCLDVNCNDTFGYACAMGLTIPLNKVDEVYDRYVELEDKISMGWYAAIDWLAKDGDCTPIPETQKRMEKAFKDAGMEMLSKDVKKWGYWLSKKKFKGFWNKDKEDK